jgi:hypothetical protein
MPHLFFDGDFSREEPFDEKHESDVGIPLR